MPGLDQGIPVENYQEAVKRSGICEDDVALDAFPFWNDGRSRKNGTERKLH